MQWDSEKRRFVQELWPTHSAGAIVGKVCYEFGEKCNRNMVIGIVHRMQRKNGLEKKGTGILPKVNTRTTRKVKSPAGTRGPMMKIKPKPEWKPRPLIGPRPRGIQCPCQLVDLESYNCHWPVGDPLKQGFYFCGAVAVPDQQYCPTHYAMAYSERRPASVFVKRDAA